MAIKVNDDGQRMMLTDDVLDKIRLTADKEGAPLGWVLLKDIIDLIGMTDLGVIQSNAIDTLVKRGVYKYTRTYMDFGKSVQQDGVIFVQGDKVPISGSGDYTIYQVCFEGNFIKVRSKQTSSSLWSEWEKVGGGSEMEANYFDLANRDKFNEFVITGTYQYYLADLKTHGVLVVYAQKSETSASVYQTRIEGGRMYTRRGTKQDSASSYSWEGWTANPESEVAVKGDIQEAMLRTPLSVVTKQVSSQHFKVIHPLIRNGFAAELVLMHYPTKRQRRVRSYVDGHKNKAYIRKWRESESLLADISKGDSLTDSTERNAIALIKNDLFNHLAKHVVKYNAPKSGDMHIRCADYADFQGSDLLSDGLGFLGEKRRKTFALAIKCENPRFNKEAVNNENISCYQGEPRYLYGMFKVFKVIIHQPQGESCYFGIEWE